MWSPDTEVRLQTKDLIFPVSCLLLGKARLHTDRGGSHDQYKSKYTINGVNGKSKYNNLQEYSLI